jgi:UDP-galactopyranose mutase
MTFLVVGAGFAGAVYARQLAEAGHKVTVIDKRPHIGGNCYDYRNEDGVLIHRYGPHLFHTSNSRVVEWLSKFTAWRPYEHRVRARLEDGRLVPMPINLTTVEAFFGVTFGDANEAAAFLARKAIPCERPRNAAEYLYSRVGKEITDTFFRRYSKKMWQLDLEEISDQVVQRVPIRLDREDRYFPNESFQFMPRDGYTRLFERILDHPLIFIELNTEFSRDMETGYAHIFNSMPIDVYFDFEFGELPYRSIRFHSYIATPEEVGDWVTINFTDESEFTRATCWSNIPGQPAGCVKFVTKEEPCDYHDNNFERYYPVKESNKISDVKYNKYKKLSKSRANVTFIGRCGTYQYLDMHQVINQTLAGSHAFLKTLK